jgi:hypothetical protein
MCSRHRRTSSQCTIENLRPALQNFPTIWRSLLAVCFGQDACSIPASPSAKNVNLAVCKYGLFEYLNWREGLFSSAGGYFTVTDDATLVSQGREEIASAICAGSSCRTYISR